MHMCCTMIVKNYSRFWDIADDKCNEGEWDYYSIGGRYSNLIPVSRRCKNVRDAERGLEWRGDGDQYTPNPNLKYVDVARLRNIDKNEVATISLCGFINIFQPYEIMIEQLDGTIRELRLDDCTIEQIRHIYDYLNDPRVQSYYVFIVDAHI